MLRHALNNFKEESGLNKLKENLSSNKKLKAFVLLSLILLSGISLWLSYKAKVLGKVYAQVVVNQQQAENFAAICAVKPEMQMCLDFQELLKTSSDLSFYFSLWQLDFFIYWWLWVWKSLDGLVKKLKEKLSS